MDIENLSFSQKQKAGDTQDLISRTIDMEFKNCHKVFTQMENQFGVVVISMKKCQFI